MRLAATSTGCNVKDVCLQPFPLNMTGPQPADIFDRYHVCKLLLYYFRGAKGLLLCCCTCNLNVFIKRILLKGNCPVVSTFGCGLGRWHTEEMFVSKIQQQIWTYCCTELSSYFLEVLNSGKLSTDSSLCILYLSNCRRQLFCWTQVQVT